VAQQVTAAWPASLLKVSRSIRWLDHSSVPTVQDVAKHPPFSGLIGKMWVALWCPPNLAVTKGLVVPSLSDHHRWPLRTLVGSTNGAYCAGASWKPSAHHLCQMFTLSTADTRYQSPQHDCLHFHLYRCCVTLHSLHTNDHGEFSHILSSCQMCLWVSESCLGEELSTRPGAPSSPACPRGE